MSRIERVIAVDWSGAVRGARRRIWLCEVARGEVRRLESGRSREEIGDHLIAEAKLDPRLAVGLDFAFSYPAGLLAKRAHTDITTVWREAELLGENWLQHCPFPFWGKKGSKKPPLGQALYRRTELEVAETTGFSPFSVLQIGGAGAVGVGTIRGMPVLARLREAGFAIWPFDPPLPPLVVEVWPRLFIGGLRKSRREERRRFLRDRHPHLPDAARAAAEASDDAFDALVTALAMDRHRDQFEHLETDSAAEPLLEGAIWRPRR